MSERINLAAGSFEYLGSGWNDVAGIAVLTEEDGIGFTIEDN